MASFVVHHKVNGSNISRTVCPRITQITRHPCRPGLEPLGYDDFSYAGRHLWKFEKTVQNAAYDGFWSTFSRAAFLPAQPIGGLLVRLDYDLIITQTLAKTAIGWLRTDVTNSHTAGSWFVCKDIVYKWFLQYVIWMKFFTIEVIVIRLIAFNLILNSFKCWINLVNPGLTFQISIGKTVFLLNNRFVIILWSLVIYVGRFVN